MISIKLLLFSLTAFGSTLAMPMKRDINVEISSLSAFATSTGAPPSTATGSPAVGTCFDAVHDAVGTVQDACGSLSSAFGGDPDSDHALLATGACKSVSAAAISAIVNTCGQALGVNVSGKNASALTAADFPDNQDAFNSGRSMGGPTTLCAQAALSAVVAMGLDSGCGFDDGGSSFGKRDGCGDAMAQSIGLITGGACST